MAERYFTNKYDDIIHLPHHVSKKHPPMARADRAAQFAPFAALTGHGESVTEAARITGQRIELDEYEKDILRGRLQYLCGCVEAWNMSGLPAEERPKAEITWFLPDLLKDGGEYVRSTGRIKKMDLYLRQILLLAEDGSETDIPIDEIIQIDGEFIEDIME